MGVNQELMMTTLLDMFERHKAILLITRDIRTLNAFTSVGDEEKDAWVRASLDGNPYFYEYYELALTYVWYCYGPFCIVTFFFPHDL